MPHSSLIRVAPELPTKNIPDLSSIPQNARNTKVLRCSSHALQCCIGPLKELLAHDHEMDGPP